MKLDEGWGGQQVRNILTKYPEAFRDRVTKCFGSETREIKQNRRVADAKLIQDVFHSFRERPLWQRVAADDQTTIQRQKLLMGQGRGRKRRRP